MSYTNIFGGSTIGPAYYSYIEYSLTAANSPINLTWPSQFVDTANNVAVIIDIQADNNGYSLVLPDAELVSVGQASVFVNKSAYTVTIYLNDGVTVLTTITTGQATYIYLTDNSTTNGTFSLIPFGAGYVAVTSVAAVSDSNNLTITGSPVINNGTFTFDFALDLLALSTFGASTGIPARTAANTWALRTITGTGNQISVTNGAGVAGNPILSLPAAVIFPGTVTLNQDAAQPLEAVTLQQLNAVAPGRQFKDSVLAISTGNFASTYFNGLANDGVGATLQATANGAFTLDGQAGVALGRYAFKDQIFSLENGIYILTQIGDGGSPAILTRAVDFDTALEMEIGSNFVAVYGVVNELTSWILTSTVVTVGVSTVTFETLRITDTTFVNVTITGTLTLTGLTASRALITNGTQEVAVSVTTSTELAYMSGVTSAVQTQLNNKISQDGSQIYAASATGTSDYAITLVPAILALTVGMAVNFRADITNTIVTPPTLNVNALGAVDILKNTNVALAAGDIKSGQIVTVVYDGVFWQMQSQSGNTAGGGGAGITWNDQTTAATTMVANNGYSVNNGAVLVTLTIPAVTSFGDLFVVTGNSTGGWTIQANAGQVVNVGNSPTSIAGTVSSSNTFDSITLVCTAANTTFSSYALQGNLTVA